MQRTKTTTAIAVVLIMLATVGAAAGMVILAKRHGASENILQKKQDPKSQPVVATVAGLFVVNSKDDSGRIVPINQWVLDNPDTSGVSLRLAWSEMEPKMGTLELTSLKSELARAKKADKKVMLRVMPGDQTPAWVFAQNVPYVSWPDESKSGNNRLVKIPVPWDAKYQQLWTNFIQRLGNALTAEEKSQIVMVQLTGANSVSGEIGLDQGASNTKANALYFDKNGNKAGAGIAKNLWVTAGYSQDNIRQSWRKFEKAWQGSFPQATLALDLMPQIVKNGTSQDVEAIITDLISNVGKKNVALQNNALKDPCVNAGCQVGRDDFDLIKKYSKEVTTGFQMLGVSGDCARTGDLGPALKWAIDSTKASYFEIYKNDLQRYAPTTKECAQYFGGVGTTCGTAGPENC